MHSSMANVEPFVFNNGTERLSVKAKYSLLFSACECSQCVCVLGVFPNKHKPRGHPDYYVLVVI